jgi:hypothetical protein
MDVVTSDHRFVENLFAPEVFVSQAESYNCYSGIVSIVFSSSRSDYSTNPPVPRRVVVERISMPLDAAKHFASSLYGYLVRLGHDPNPRPPDVSVQ